MRKAGLMVVTFICVSMNIQDLWRPFPPMALRPVLKGNFGELRSNHFHSGVDFGTEGKVGQPVRASFEGYVSRIKVSEYGFGKAMYVDHPNGYTTVYAHLHRFAPAIERLVTEEQFKQKKYSVELFPEKNKLTVSTGDTIAWSGNSGGSAGPHLHYEIRDTKTEKPLNPLRFLAPVKDTIPPVINTISLYALNTDFTSIQEITEMKPIRKPKADYLIEKPVHVSALTGFGFSAVDYANDDSSVLGIYEMELYVGEQKIYSYKMENFAFDEIKNINGHIDYSKKQKKGKVTEWSFRLPGNTFSQYRDVVNNGIIKMDSLNSVVLKLILKDINGNKSICTLPLVFDPQITLKKTHRTETERISYNKKAEIVKLQYKLSIPDGALFRSVNYFDSLKRREKGFYSDRITLFDASEPLKKNLNLSIKCNLSESALADKLLLVKISDKGELSAVNSNFKNGYVSGSISTFGSYAVAVDTLPPVISNYESGFDSVYNCKVIMIRVKDNLSGIKSYSVTINGSWVVSEYDYKSERIVIYLKEKFADTIQLELMVSDAKLNQAFSKQEIILR